MCLCIDLIRFIMMQKGIVKKEKQKSVGVLYIKFPNEKKTKAKMQTRVVIKYVVIEVMENKR